MNFEQSYNYLLSLGNEVTAMKLGLDAMRILLEGLGDPQTNYLKVQVAGTNGKGSVCAFLDSICNTAGIKTGTFTSPHLVSVTERIRINGCDISESDFARIASFVRVQSEWLVAHGRLESIPTFFEQVTAIALVAFAEASVELAILETGLGGRLDATTAANAEIVAITRIDYDHQEILGDRIEEIAAEKAAIIHPGCEAVLGPQRPEILKILRDRCERFGVRFIDGSDQESDWRISPNDDGIVSGETTQIIFESVPLGLKGRHQAENAQIALWVVQLLRYGKGFDIDDGHVMDGLVNARHPGRLESSGRYLFDGAHNVGGAKVLRAYLDEFIDKPITMIFGAMNDKDVREIAETLLPKADVLILTKSENPRAMPAGEIGSLLSDVLDNKHVVETASMRDALQKAEQLSKRRKIILVTGSLYLVGEAKKILNN